MDYKYYKFFIGSLWIVPIYYFGQKTYYNIQANNIYEKIYQQYSIEEFDDFNKQVSDFYYKTNISKQKSVCIVYKKWSKL